MNLIQNGELVKWEGDGLVVDINIIELASRCEVCTFMHVGRAANSLAHNLVKCEAV